MTKSELIARLAERHPDLKARIFESIVTTVFDEISDALERGDRVELRGFLFQDGQGTARAAEFRSDGLTGRTDPGQPAADPPRTGLPRTGLPRTGLRRRRADATYRVRRCGAALQEQPYRSSPSGAPA